MSQHGIILRFKSEKEYHSSKEIEATVKVILREHSLSDYLVSQLPYESPQSPIRLIVPEGLKAEQTYYLYYSNGSRNRKLSKIRDVLANCDHILQVMNLEAFIQTKSAEDDGKTDMEKENHKLKRRLEEVETEKVETLQMVKKLKTENFIIAKEVQVFRGNYTYFASRYGGNISPISWEPFRFDKNAIALQSFNCCHAISRSDYHEMSQNQKIPFCPQCKLQELSYFHEDWALTLASTALYLESLVKFHEEPLNLLQTMIEDNKEKFVKVKAFDLLYSEFAQKVAPAIVYHNVLFDQGTLSEEDLPKFANDPTGVYNLNSDLLNSLSGLNQANIKKYLQKKREQIIGAKQWITNKYGTFFDHLDRSQNPRRPEAQRPIIIPD